MKRISTPVAHDWVQVERLPAVLSYIHGLGGVGNAAATVGSVEGTSPEPGFTGPAAAKTRQSINISQSKAPQSQVGLPKKESPWGYNEPPEEFSGIKERRQRTLQVVPPQA